jgi:hypothetical protein
LDGVLFSFARSAKLSLSRYFSLIDWITSQQIKVNAFIYLHLPDIVRMYHFLDYKVETAGKNPAGIKYTALRYSKFFDGYFVAVEFWC